MKVAGKIMPAIDNKKQKAVTDEQKTTVHRTWEWLKGLPSLWKGVVAVATGLAAVLGVVASLFPSWLPQPPSSETWAEITALREGPHISLEDFLQRPGIAPEAKTDAETILSAEQRDKVGSVVFFEVEATGYEGEPIHIVYSVYEANTDKAISELTKQPAWPNNSIEPKSEGRKLALETWVPFPREGEGPFLVSLHLYGDDPAEGRLDEEEVTISPS
jgi:hypothetical protein